MDNEKMIESIRTLCKNRNITPTKLEEELGFSQGLISRWKDKNPNIDRIIDIADYFHVSLDEVVGYNINTNDIFLSKLHEQTENDSITWENCETMNQHGFKVKQYSDFDTPGTFIGEYEKETSYAICFNSGYIVMYAYHRYDQILNPYNLVLFIQPNDDAVLVDQHYTKDELYSLWIKILNHLRDNAPDEIKAEDLKNSFINDRPKFFIDLYTDEQLLQITQKMIEMEPDLPKLFEAVNDPNFKKFLQILNLSQSQENFIMAQKLSKYYEELKRIQK